MRAVTLTHAFLLLTNRGCLLDAAFVQRLAVSGGVLKVLLIGAGEVMGATEILFGAHVEVVVLHGIEDSVEASNRRNTDGARGKARIAIGVVGTVDGKHGVIDALQGEVLQGEFHGGVGL